MFFWINSYRLSILQERGSWPDVTNNMPYRVTTSPPNSFSIYMEDAEVLVKVSYFLVGK